MDKNKAKTDKTSTRMERARDYGINGNFIWSIEEKNIILKDRMKPNFIKDIAQLS